MASRVMHLAAASLLLENMPQGMDVPRFLSGSIMVDSAPQERRASHFLFVTEGRKTYDIARFRAQYGHLLLEDGLVLGYYLHLLQDLVFRDFMYHKLKFDPKKPGYLAGLHSDYRRLNRLLISRYSLQMGFDIPTRSTPLDGIAAFDMAGLPQALRDDFTMPGAENAFFLTEDLAMRYVETAVENCRKELHALRHGGVLTDPLDWTWQTDPV